MIWNKEMECADRETMRALQLKKLKETVKYEYDNVPYYREKMDKAGVKPEDIQTLEDIKSATEEELAEVEGMNSRSARQVFEFFHIAKNE